MRTERRSRAVRAQVHAPGGVFDEEQDVQAAQEHGAGVEEVSRQHRVGWAVGNVRHVWPCRSGAGPMPAALRIFQMVDGAAV